MGGWRKGARGRGRPISSEREPGEPIVSLRTRRAIARAVAPYGRSVAPVASRWRLLAADARSKESRSAEERRPMADGRRARLASTRPCERGRRHSPHVARAQVASASLARQTTPVAGRRAPPPKSERQAGAVRRTSHCEAETRERDEESATQGTPRDLVRRSSPTTRWTARAEASAQLQKRKKKKRSGGTRKSNQSRLKGCSYRRSYCVYIKYA